MKELKNKLAIYAMLALLTSCASREKQSEFMNEPDSTFFVDYSTVYTELDSNYILFASQNQSEVYTSSDRTNLIHILAFLHKKTEFSSDSILLNKLVVLGTGGNENDTLVLSRMKVPNKDGFVDITLCPPLEVSSDSIFNMLTSSTKYRIGNGIDYIEFSRHPEFEVFLSYEKWEHYMKNRAGDKLKSTKGEDE